MANKNQHIPTVALYAKTLGPDILGAKIVGFVNGGMQDGIEYWGLEIQTKDGAMGHLWVDADPEGNGPGHLAFEKIEKGG